MSRSDWWRPTAERRIKWVLQGLEVIPRRRVVYRGIEIHEMDVDAILRTQAGRRAGG